MAWIREGECCRCGDCCRGGVDGLPEQADGSCPHLRRDGGPASCVIHGLAGSYWSKGCKVWPTEPWHIAELPRCTYTFREVSAGGC